MGPTALFDKSFLEGLNPDQAVWFDHFFLANVCPIFYVETQSDLAKEGSDRGTPEELVRKLAIKFPDFSGSPNVHHATICTANLLGEEVPQRGQVILPSGCQAIVSGHPMAMQPVSPEAKVFLRWTRGEYTDEEREVAAQWRGRSAGYATADVIKILKSMGAYDQRPCGTLVDVRRLADDVMNRLDPAQQIVLGVALLGVFQDQHDNIKGRFRLAGEPPLATFAPYVDYCLRVELFFHLAVEKSRMSAAQRIDLCYLFYLPFCEFFVSNDWVHKRSAPLFLREDQQFVVAQDLKTALGALNDYYMALPEADKNKSIHQIAPHPPKDRDNLVTKLWDHHWPKWREPKTIRGKKEDLIRLTAAWKEHIKELELIAKARAGNTERIPVEHMDALIVSRVARKRKGSWWMVPHELRNQSPEPDDQVFEFHNSTTPENVINQKVEVYVRGDTPDISSMPDCQIFVEDHKLHVDLAPPLKRRYTAPVPKGAMFARSRDGEHLGVFVAPSSDVAKLMRILWEKEKKRGGIGES
jgi:hypothetical protein